MKKYTTYKFRLYPNKTQEAFFKMNFKCVRDIYDLIVQNMEWYYMTTGNRLFSKISYYREKYPYMQEADSSALNYVNMKLKGKWEDFLHGRSDDYPHPGPHDHYNDSYTTQAVENINITEGKVRLPKIGYVRIKQHREIPKGYRLKEVTVKRQKDGKYFACMVYEYENNVPAVKPQNIIGLDHSLMKLYVDSNGDTPEFEHYRHQLNDKIERERQKLSKMQKGSRNYTKQWIKIAGLYQKASDRRINALHKISKALADKYDAVCIEDLDIKAMLEQNGCLGKLVLDNGWSMFTVFLQYKLEEQGKQLIKVDRHFPSSQICSHCGKQNHAMRNYDFKNGPYIKEWDCPYCGAHHDRDVNAAINIRNEGMRIMSV